jgi:LmbE family N-acetylglucosaminyl deacetylase
MCGVRHSYRVDLRRPNCGLAQAIQTLHIEKPRARITSCAVILSLVSNEQWLRDLREVPAWAPLAVPALVVAPHPDDETLGAGALIATLRAKGIPVTVVAVTDGENAYETAPAERAELGEVREAEQREALEKLGVAEDNIYRLRMTDSALMQQEQQLTTELMKLADHGMQIIAPWDGDFHPDHMACAHAAEAVAKAKGLPLISYFFWTWHRGTMDILAGLPLRRFMPTDAALQARADALACHRSQFEHSSGEPILPERLLGPARWPFEVFLQG